MLGRVCVRGRGACNSSYRTVYRYLDFYRRLNKSGKLLKIYYDTNRTGKIGLIMYENGLSCFILLQKGIKTLDYIYSGAYLIKNYKINKGDSVLLNDMPLFSIISNIEMKPYNGGIFSRAAGVGALLISKDKFKGTIKLNSGWQLKLPLNCISSFGAITNKWNNNIIGKAGKNRGLGKKT